MGRRGLHAHAHQAAGVADRLPKRRNDLVSGELRIRTVLDRQLRQHQIAGLRRALERRRAILDQPLIGEHGAGRGARVPADPSYYTARRRLRRQLGVADVAMAAATCGDTAATRSVLAQMKARDPRDAQASAPSTWRHPGRAAPTGWPLIMAFIMLPPLVPSLSGWMVISIASPSLMEVRRQP
jgi:hypothetical protein